MNQLLFSLYPQAQKLPTTQRSAKPRPSKQSPLPSTSRPPPPASPPRPIQSKSTTSSSSSDWWSSLLGVALLIVMFAVTFLVYDHYTSPDNSFVSQGFDYLKQHGIFKPQEWKTNETTNDTQCSTFNLPYLPFDDFHRSLTPDVALLYWHFKPYTHTTTVDRCIFFSTKLEYYYYYNNNRL